jgi:hypothetical protein
MSVTRILALSAWTMFAWQLDLLTKVFGARAT